MSEFFCTLNGNRVPTLRLCVPNAGAWFADCDLDEAVTLSGRVELKIGAATLSGTVRDGGAFVAGARVRVVGGADGWGRLVRPKAYHNDAGVKALHVATDAARETGEALGSFAPTKERLGADYVRRACPASRVLEDCAGSAPWWVGLDGKTNIGPRPTYTSAAELLEFDPRNEIAILVSDELTDVLPGAVVPDSRLGGSRTVRELELLVEAGKLRATCWTGGSAEQGAKLPELLAVIAQRATDSRLHGLWRYRVVSMAADGRVNLQAVRKAAGLPDVLPVPQRPGVAGAHAELTPGSEVLVQFVEGDPTLPIVTGFSQKGENGFSPTLLSFLDGTRPVARVGDAVQVFVSSATPIPIVGTVGVPPATTPLTGTITIATPLTGVISSGNPKVLA
jgi:hypothetical protein